MPTDQQTVTDADALDAALLAMLDIAEQGHGENGELSEDARAQIDRIVQMAQNPKKLLAGEVPEAPGSPDTEEKARTPLSGWRPVHQRIMRQFGRGTGTTQKMLTQEQTLAARGAASLPLADADPDSPGALARARAADLVTFGSDVKGGARCSNCEWIGEVENRDYCKNPKVKQFLPAKRDKVCCSDWDRFGTIRRWQQESGATAKSWTPDTVRGSATGGTGGVEHPERTSDPKLGDDMRRVELMADILGGLLGKRALLAFAGEDVEDAPGDTEKAYGVFDGADAWYDWLTRRAWDELQHPRGKGGRFIKKGSAESYAAAKVAIRQTLRDRAKAATPEHAQKLAELLSILTVKQLHELKREHGLQASGRLREQLIAKLVDRLPGAQERMDKERKLAAVELGLDKDASLEDIIAEVSRKHEGVPERADLEAQLSALGISTPVLRGEAMQHALAMAEKGIPEKKTKAEEKVEAPGAPPAEPKHGKVYNVATSELHVDPERFQYKVVGIGHGGVGQELKAVRTWNPDFAGVISVWKDPATGKTFVVNGHHRRELAGRLGVEDMAVRYINARDAKEARAIGALINIAEGRGTAIDAAKFMRDTGTSIDDMESHGVSLRGKLAADAAVLTKLSDRAFDKLARGTLDETKALAVAKHLDDHSLQDQLFNLLEKREDEGKDLSPRVIEEMARTMAETPKTKTTEHTLFGDIESEESLFVPRAEVAASVRAGLAKEVNDWLAVSSKRRAEKVGGAGNVLNVEENKRLAEEADRVKNVFDSLANRKGAISEALNAAAEDYHKAKTKKERESVKQRALESVRDAVLREAGVGQGERQGIESEAESRGEAAGVSGGDAAGAAEPGAGADAVSAELRRGDSGETGLAGEAQPPEPGFTGIDANGHKWENGKQVKREEEPTAPQAGERIPVNGVGDRGTYDLEVKGVKDGKVQIGYPDSPHVRKEIPEKDFKEFVNDLIGKVDVTPDSGNAAVDAVASGKGEFLGKGDDGLAFRVGDKVVKVSTILPYIPDNPFDRTPEQAANMLREQTDTSEAMRKAGVPGILPTVFVEHDGKGFQIRPYVEIPKQLSKEQLDKVQQMLDDMHARGYSLNDDVQVGLHNGEPVFFDTGKADELPDSKQGREDAVELDNIRLRNLYKKNGQKFAATSDENIHREWEEIEGEAELRMFGEDKDNLSPEDQREADELRTRAEAVHKQAIEAARQKYGDGRLFEAKKRKADERLKAILDKLPEPKATVSQTPTDALDITPSNVKGVWETNRDAILKEGGKDMSPAQAGNLAAARILNAVRDRAAEYRDEIDAKVRRGEKITDEEDAKYVAAEDARRNIYDALVEMSGYRPYPDLDNAPEARKPLAGMGKAEGERQAAAKSTSSHSQPKIDAALSRYANRDQTARGGGLFGGEDLQARQGFAKLPDGAAVVFTGGQHEGQTGRIVHDDDPTTGQPRIMAQVDGQDGLVPISPDAIEPLDAHLSWRVEGGGSGAAAKQGGLFGGAAPAKQEESVHPDVAENRAIMTELNKMSQRGETHGEIRGVPVERKGAGDFIATIGGKKVHGDLKYISSRIQEEARKQGAGAGAEAAGAAGPAPTTGKTDSGETVRLGRIKPVEPITFAQPIAGPSGVKLLGYEWQYKPEEEYNDRTGEIETRRVSDWEKAERNIETGRDVVHHFTIQGPDGKRQTVSLETALQKMGYGGGKEGGGAIKTLASSVKTLAKNRMELQIAEARKATYDTAIDEAKGKIAEMPQPKVETEEHPDGRRITLRMGDARISYFRSEYERSRALKIPEEKLQLLRSSWEQRRIDELVPKEIRDLKYGSSSTEAIADLKKRIARAEAKVKSAVESAAKSSSEAVPTATATPPEPRFTGEDALGRKWEDGKLVAAEKNPQENSPTAIDESGKGGDNTSGGGENAQKPEGAKVETTTRHPGLQSVYEELAKREASPKYAGVRAKLEAMTPDEQAALAAYVAEGGGSRAKKVLERIAEGKPPMGMTQEQATAAEQDRRDAAMAPERARREAEEKERQAKREAEEKEARARLEDQRAKDEAARKDRERKQADAAAIETQAAPFRRAIAMNPIDDSARLIFADWLEEHGRSAEAHDQRAMATPAPESKPPVIPPKQPHNGFETVSWQRMKDAIKSKFLPREPKEGERLLLINRPQNGPHSFVEYNKGEIVMQGDSAYIIVASKPGFTRGGEGWKRWEQLAVARPANATEIAYALAQKKVEQWRGKTKPYDDYHTSGYQTEEQRQEAEEWLRRYEQDPLAAYRAQQESEKR